MNSIDADELRALLKRSEIFQHLRGRELDALAREMAWFSLPGGAPLFEAGDVSDALYVVKAGSMGAFGVPRSGGVARLLGVIPRGSTLGELGLITGQPRETSVRALRDSELLRLSRAGFDALVRAHPEAMLGAARSAVIGLTERVQQRGKGEPVSAPHTFALLPFDDKVDLHGFAERLRKQMLIRGDCLVIGAALGAGRSTDWFAQRESEVRFVLYMADGDEGWRQLCQRQADALLLVVDAACKPAAWPDDEAIGAPNMSARPRHLVLLQPHPRFIYGAARAWRTALRDGELRHHHVRHREDVARIARLLSGDGTGLVLSGGGARGFAQIGVIRALREAGIVVDSVIGTSIGAIIGAGVAYEWDDLKMHEAYRRALVDGKPLSDWTLPLVALTRGARTTMLLREAFGEIDIEDLPIDFACLSADLTRGAAAVHRSGLLWRWLRASGAVPGILPPLLHQGHVYVDGAVVNNLPTDVLSDEGLRRIIAVDISADDMLTAHVEEAASPHWPTLWAQRRSGGRPNAFAILVRAGMLNSEAGSARRRELASLLLRPHLEAVGLLDWHEFERAIEAGYGYTLRALEENIF
ncbi:MAG TPA: patatin-like phospholipase family protein [Rhodanobacteraceae bacterium]|nr:patatin-like phospholipase family protein [Rhodanobacteraceae bacterium]